MILSKKEEEYLSIRFWNGLRDIEEIIDDDPDLDYETSVLYEEMRIIWSSAKSTLNDAQSDVDMNPHTRFSIVKELTTCAAQMNALMKLEL